MKKIIPILMTAGLFLIIMGSSLNVNADENHNYDNDINRIYKAGKDKGIIHEVDMTYKQFVQTMKHAVIPCYNNFKRYMQKMAPNQKPISLDQYTAEDNYEVPFISPNDNPTIVSASGKGKHPFAYLMYGTKLKVKSNQINIYKDRSFKQKTNHFFKKNTIIQGEFVQYGQITRFKTNQGYVTSNTHFIKRVFK
ncbi:hypothetical protein DY120_01020 [Apilactobacillus micheneri]|uniref:DUF5776 domain-containing protein n=1 Tax=Apilactobacillus micheneri TaxID=1899430 RepID=A0ABY2YYL9_9LACO|nr:DUF5776 domain-containing protein [Apilactobacillus micheneri]TPR26308.1 hypothetical protein DY114_01020 [Apilactobacillus micheneri]TPR27062.1 hypothetical protein DY111_01020 [Apilactobacillus micheneri]TPR27920.1 hypothetical protein DY113_04795 [Apilactobacillus micheneri]TPR31825.1 hypothetical protein DY117_01020 [Apilactobacillus micheneri]TPR32229.1 hypothetical protein DY120_01020 [Apilactobacillus micheneri]